jgi:hypothetical protein
MDRIWDGDFTNALLAKTLFIVPSDAHYYKTIEMLKQYKSIVLAKHRTAP